MPVNIHGKEYKTVAERLNEFYDKYSQLPDIGTSINTAILKDEGNIVQVVATIEVTGETGSLVYGTGHAEEDRSKGRINDTSALENAETSAIGRALASIGLGGTEFASADELANALKQQESTGGASKVAANKIVSLHPDANAIGFGKHKGKSWDEVPKAYLEWLVNRESTDPQTMESAKQEIASRDLKDSERIKSTDDAVKTINTNIAKEKVNLNDSYIKPKNNESLGSVLAKTVPKEIATEVPTGLGLDVISEHNNGMSPLSQEKQKEKLATRLTELSEQMGIKKFIELKTTELGSKGFHDCNIGELQGLVSIAESKMPKETIEMMKKQGELLEKVVDTFDGQIIR